KSAQYRVLVLTLIAGEGWKRLGHKSSGRLQKGLEADVQTQAILETIQRGQLVDEHGPQGEAAGVDQPLSGHLTMPVEDAFERLIDVLNRPRAPLVKEAPDFDSVIGMGIGAIVSRDEDPSRWLASQADVRGVVVPIPQHVA